MAKKIPSKAVPALRFSPQEDAELRHLGSQLERELMVQYETFLFRDQRSIDASKWKLAKSEGDVYAYTERHVKQRHRRDRPDANTELGPQQKLAKQSILPRVLVTGTIPGTLDDAMYGTTFHDTPSYQTFWAAQGDRVEESAVVAKLEGPRVDDPHRFVGVVWFLRTFPLNLLQRRDYLCSTFTGIMHLSNGERVGFFVGQSIEHRGLAELHELNTIRGTSSLLTIYRQLDANRVEVFTLHLLDTKGMVSDRRHVLESITHMLPLTASVCDAGFRKKFEWLVYRRKRDHLDATPCDAIEPQSSGTNDHCELCAKRLGALFRYPGTACELCYQRVCMRCSASHNLVVVTSAGKTLKSHDFCVQCSLKARAMPTLTVAQQEVQYRHTTSISNASNKPRGRVLTMLMSVDSPQSYE